jgi:DNA-binding response OmpR family regulator
VADIGGGAKQHLGRVLVADDDAAIRRVCARILSHEGWQVTTCESGKHAVQAAEAASVPFDCVLSDVNMPEMDGFELVRTLREKDDDLPVLLMTGDPSLDGAVRAIDYGAVSYIAKPFDHESLASQVARAARRHGVQRMRRRAESWARELFGEAPREIGSLESRFANAILRSWMAFQPIVDVANQTIFAYEALLRTDEESLRRPDIFISTAERLDKVQLLGRTVRDAVARAAPQLPEGANLFVNVHGLELNDEELFSANSALAHFAPRVVLEITERRAHRHRSGRGPDARGDVAPARLSHRRR